MPYATKKQCQRQIIDLLPDQCCVRCEFFEKTDDASAELVDYGDGPHYRIDLSGNCRRRSPVAAVVDGSLLSVFPEVEAVGWCGEFKLSLEDRGIDYVCSPMRLIEAIREDSR